ncbi:MAG: response regulator [Pseudohongiellaceae bacterium]
MMEFDSNAERDARLLIVDDNADITDILEEVGLDAGFSVKSAHSLSELKDSYADFSPGVILLDLGLGGEADIDEPGSDDDGLKALQYLSAEGCKARILIISGSSRRKRELTQYQGQGLNLRVIGHLPKPFDVDTVEQTLVKLREKGL